MIAIDTRYHRPSFSSPSQPKASVIIPVHNHWAVTLSCLSALERNTPDTPFEVIVVDDGSTDATPDILAACEGIIILRLDTNQGFIEACNSGALRARGEYLIFLNNDTQVQPGWLDALLTTFLAQKRAAIVGGRLVYPSGRLQEAGALVFRDGSAWNYGHLDDPYKPQYSYARRVDYVSGAALAVLAERFFELGGFDAAYAPAYYEDTDLCFRAWQTGYEVWYQPQSTVVHIEGQTAGVDIASEGSIKRYQARNQEIFYQRWKHQLEGLGERSEQAEQVERVARRHSKRHALIVDTYMIRPDHDSGSVRLANLCTILSELKVQVTFAAINLEAPEPYVSALQGRGIEVLFRPYVRSLQAHLKSHGPRYDLVFLARADTASSLVGTVRRHCPAATVIYDTVDLHYLREQRLAALNQCASSARWAALRKRQELQLAAIADTTLVVSPVEKELLQTELPGRDVRVLSNIVPLTQCPTPFDQRWGALFVGAFEHTPNVDAMVWFIDEILELVIERIPRFTLTVIGANPPPKITRRSTPRVRVLGHVPDLTPYLCNNRVSIAPLRFGAGIKGKITQSLATGLPVIATRVAVEGMPLQHATSALIADEPSDFAANLVAAHSDRELWRRLAKNGLSVAANHYGPESARPTITQLVDL